jgi:hypothetical protein
MKVARPLCHALLVVATACGGRAIEHVESGAAGSDSRGDSGGSSATAPAESAPAGLGGTSSSAGAAPSTTTPPPEPNGGRPSGGQSPAGGSSGASAPAPSNAGTGSSASNGNGTTGNGTTGNGTTGNGTTGSGTTGNGTMGSNSGTEVPVPNDYPDIDGRTHYFVAGLTDEGLVLAAYWTGSVEAVALVDPGTGERTDVGTLGDLNVWTGTFIYDDRTRMAYAVGENAAQQGYLYSFSLDDRETTQAALTDLLSGNIVLGGVTREGSIVAAAWVPPTLVEIEPTTGKSTPVGPIEGMTNWDGNLVYDDATRVVYALGHADGIDDNYLFTTKLDSAKTTELLLARSETGAIYYTVGGLDPHGQLVAAYWDGMQEAIVTLDPTDASTETVGSLGDLKDWDDHLVYNASLQRVVAFGWSPSKVGQLYETDIGR